MRETDSDPTDNHQSGAVQGLAVPRTIDDSNQSEDDELRYDQEAKVACHDGAIEARAGYLSRRTARVSETSMAGYFNRS